MRPFLLTCALSAVAACANPSFLYGQTSGCTIPEPPFHSNKPNIFNDQQEQWLGDAQASQTEAQYDLLPEKGSAELDRIAGKLLAQLPPTPVRYTFRVYESDEANGFSLAGGHVYISRKLITDARSEDEMAGVLAHEIGHIYTHQVAIVFTRDFRAMLNVNSVSTREDVEDKVQLMMNAPWKNKADLSEDDEEKDELLADRVGMYALIRAGYAPKAFGENLDRIAANKGHTGNFLTDVLGGTTEISRRVRTARKIAASLPSDCSRLDPSSSPEFKAFQDAIRNVPIHPLVEPTPRLDSVKLDPPMRPGLGRVRFSPDGKYILAQDESSVHVLSRSPLKRLFSIDAPGAQAAKFSPDSSFVVFDYPTLRVERWEIATGKRESFHELIDYEGCPQSSISPDGNTFVCLSRTGEGVWLKLTDVATGKLFLDEKRLFSNFASRDYVIRSGVTTRLGSVHYSQDGRTMLILVGARALAYDLVSRKTLSLGHDLGHLMDGPAVFVDSNKLVYECDTDYKSGSSQDTFKICETTFPDGMPLNNFQIGYQWLEPITRGDRILVGPFKDNAAMLADPATGKATAGFKLDSLDVYDSVLAIENDRGGLTVSSLDGQQAESAELPAGPIRDVEAAGFSPDGRFLAFSNRARSTIWDLTTRKRVALMRPFRAVRFDAQNVMYAQYTETHQRPGQNFQIDLKTGKAVPGAKFSIDQYQQGDALVTLHPEDKAGGTLSNVDLQVVDGATGASLWSRRFPHDAPIVRNTDDGRLLFIFDLYGDTASEDTNHPKAKLIKTSDTRSEWIAQGQLVEIVDSHTGAVQQEIKVSQRHASSEAMSMTALFGDYLVVYGNYNNSVVYRSSDGLRLGAFYGRAIAGDSKLGLIAATNRDQEVILIDAVTGKELKRVTVDHLPRTARFIPSKNQLLVLTASQTVYSIDLPGRNQMDQAQAASH